MVSWMPSRVAVPISPTALLPTHEMSCDPTDSTWAPTAQPGEQRALDDTRRHFLRLVGHQADDGDAGPQHQHEAEQHRHTGGGPGPDPPGQDAVQGRKHHVQHQGAEQPGAERPDDPEKSQPQRQDEPGSPLALGVQE
jgi:hypothetical protein